jgi:selenide,water dikinase
LTQFSHGGGCGCKIAPGVLEQILAGSARGFVPPDLLVGIETADDAAVYRINDSQAIVATTDFFMPIVDDPHDFGAIAATNAISDIYAMGATPLFALALLAMPVKQLPLETIRRIVAGGEAIGARAGIPIAGGHTIDSVEPIYGLAVIGSVHPDRIKRNGGAKPGDALILGKPLGVGIYSAALRKDALSSAAYRDLIASTTQLNTPGIELGGLAAVHAMTDVTGFGLLGHLLEVCRASGIGASIDFARIPLLSDAAELAKRGYVTGASGRNFDGYGAHVALASTDGELVRSLLTDPQTSGGLLVACAEDAVDQVLEIFRRKGFDRAATIGVMGESPPRVSVR